MIEEINENYINQVCELHLKYFANENSLGNKKDITIYYNYLYKVAKKYFFICKKDCKVVGFICCRRRIDILKEKNLNFIPDPKYNEINNSLQILYLAVDSNFRNRGIATSLLKKIASKAKAGKEKTLILYAKSENIKAQRLYEKNNYKKIGVNANGNSYLYKLALN